MAGKNKEISLERLKKKVLPMIDTRATDDNGILVQRDRKITVIDIFGSEQRASVAYFVSDLLAKGFNNQQIIDTVKNKYGLIWTMRQVNIVKDLLKRIWRAEIAHTMNDQIAKELAVIDTQLKELWEAWEFSKKGIKHTKSRKTKSTSPADEMTFDVTETIVDDDITAGDPRYMQQITALGTERRKLLGLYAPEKREEKGSGNTAIQVNVVGQGAGVEAANLMKTILNQGAPTAIEGQQVEEAQVVKEPVEVEVTPEQQQEQDMDAFWNQFMMDD